MRKSSRGNPWHDSLGRFCHGPTATIDTNINKVDEVNYNIREKAKENGNYNDKDARDLRNLTKRALESNGGGKQNLWSIQHGGYDLYYEVYYNNKPVFGVLNGFVEIYNKEYTAYAQVFSITSGYDIKKISFSQISEKANILMSDEYEDGTYDVEMLEMVEYNDGYQVTYCQIGDNYAENEHDELIKEFLLQTDDERVSLGKFEGIPEHSFHFSSKEKAIKYAKKYNQISIWDWENQCEIEIGGTGKNDSI